MESVNVEIFGADPKIQKALGLAKNLSVSKSPVLISGETGVGKKTLARFIHQSSVRSDAPFEVVDCGGSPEEVENAILGHRDENGRFVRGALEKGNGGTVVIGNIDNMDEEFQKKFHKILNELADYEIDVRVIATTTKNLSKLVGAGRFYRALYTYIASNNIFLPPLRERTADLEMLAQKFTTEISHGEKCLHESAMNKIMSHYWTHNIRELKTVIESSASSCENTLLTDQDLEIGEKRAVNMLADEENEGIRLMSLKEAEKLLIKKALVHTSENRTQAAKILGVSIRTLRNKINEYRSSGSSYFVNLR